MASNSQSTKKNSFLEFLCNNIESQQNMLSSPSSSNSSSRNSESHPSRTNSNSSAQEGISNSSSSILSTQSLDPWDLAGIRSLSRSYLLHGMDRERVTKYVENDNQRASGNALSDGLNGGGNYDSTIAQCSEMAKGVFGNGLNGGGLSGVGVGRSPFGSRPFTDDSNLPYYTFDSINQRYVPVSASQPVQAESHSNNLFPLSNPHPYKVNEQLPFRRNSQTNSGRCNRCDNIASLRCLECNINTCEECSLIHSTLLQHRVIPVPPPIGTAPKSLSQHYCQQHNELLRYVCVRCHKVICKTSKIQDHGDHECSQIGEYRRDYDNKIKSSIQTTSEGIQHVRSAIDRTVQFMSMRKQTAMEVKNDMHNCFNQMIRCIQDRERFMVEALTNACDRDLQILDSQKAGLQNILSGLADTNNTLHILDANGDKMDDIELSLKLTACHRQLDEHITGFRSLQPKNSVYLFMAPDAEVMQSIRESGVLINDNKFIVNGFIGNSMKALYSQYPSLGEITNTWSRGTVEMPSVSGSSPLMQPVNSVKRLIFGGPSMSFAEEGHKDGQVSRPWGLCVDRFGNILISDRRNNRVQIFDSHGNLKMKFGRQGDGDGEFDLPAGICVDIDDRIIVVDKDNHRVQIFDQNGVFVQKFGTRGTEYGQFQYPWDVAVNTRRQIVVTDSRNHRIQQFNSKGRFIRHILFNDYSPNKNPASPRGVCYTPTGNIIVSDFDNHCLYLINPEENKNVKVVGCEGNGPQLQFNRPSGIFCDDSGNIILADSKNQRILSFNSQFMFMWQLDIRPSRNSLMPSYIDEKDRTCDVALLPDGRTVILIELSPDSKEGCNPKKKFVHIF